MIKGSIYVLSFLLISFLIFTTIEFFGHFNSTIRTFLFYGYIFINLIIMGYYIVTPLFKLYQIGKLISHKQAAQIIGSHFKDVQDKLLNTLQLESMSKITDINQELLEASIDQRAQELNPIPFSNAINIKENKKYIKYSIAPIIVILILLIGVPEVLTEGSTRIVEHNKYFEKPIPYEFMLLNNDLKALRNDDFKVELQINADALPTKVYLYYEGREYLMDQVKANKFEYIIKNVRNDIDFLFRIANYKSHSYKLNVLPKPILKKFNVQVQFPAYINKDNLHIENIGDLTIPAGSKVTWDFYTQDIDQLKFTLNERPILLSRSGKNHFQFSQQFLNDAVYGLVSANKHITSNDSVLYFVNVVPDAYPRISLSKSIDTLKTKYLFFSGEISDDYGLRKLTFNYRFTKVEDTTGKKLSDKIIIPIASSKNFQSFLFNYDLNNLNIKAGESVEYYFEVWDNDGVNGSKSSTSDRFYFETPSKKELEEKSEELSENIKEDIEKAANKAFELQKEFEEARKKLLENKKLDWEDKKFVEDLIQKQKDLQKDIEELKKEFEANVTMKDEYQELSEEVLKKYEQLYKMFDEILPEELKELYNELEKLMNENMKDQIQDELENMNLKNKDVEKELDRMLELMKKVEFEQKANEIADKLEELSQKQEELAKETENNKKDSKETEEKQNRLNADFKDIKEDIDKLEKMNEEMENPQQMENFEQDEKSIEEEQNKSMQNMKSGKSKKAAQNQKNAAKQMKDMAQKMKDMQMEMEMKSLEINIQKLRQILENLVYLSFEQEQLMNDFKTTNSYNPKYVELAQKQQKLKSDAKMVEDSLFALSKELPMIESVINKELNEVNYNMAKAIQHLAAREVSKGRAKQQFVMTSVNNIAVILSEILEQMQNQMQSQMMSKSGKNKKKGKKNKPGMGDLKDLQESLNKQIEAMKKGEKPGKGMSKQLAKMAAQQEMLRNQLRQMEMEQKKNGQKPTGDLDKIQELMEQTEKDLVNKNITSKTLERQKEITVKLLEAEKAELEQGKDEKRKAKTARDIFKNNPPSLEEYNKQKLKEVEMLQSVPPSLSPFYRIKVKEYFEKLND